MPHKDPDARRKWAREYARKWGALNPGRIPYTSQKKDAKRRGIPFLLTFEEWWDFWQKSGKWEQRGQRRGQYVMARFGDVGPYALGNIYVCLIEANSLAMIQRRPDLKQYLTLARVKGKPKSEAHRAAVSKARKAHFARIRHSNGDPQA